MEYHYDYHNDKDGAQPPHQPNTPQRTPNPNGQSNDFGAWLLIGIMFLVAWPVGLILLIKKLTDNPKTKRAAANTAAQGRSRVQQTRTQAQQSAPQTAPSVQQARPAQPKKQSAVQKVTQTPQPSAGGAKALKIVNYARGELVNTAALLEAMETGKVSGYMTDFPTEAILGKPGIVCTPHLGASTPEAEDNCAAMAVQEISDYLKNGNIIHSVNMPEVHQPRAGGKRICIIHKNEPGMISQITALTTEAGLNIENMVNKSKKNMAYTMLDATGAVDGRLAEKLAAIPAVIRVRIL